MVLFLEFYQNSNRFNISTDVERNSLRFSSLPNNYYHLCAVTYAFMWHRRRRRRRSRYSYLPVRDYKS